MYSLAEKHAMAREAGKGVGLANCTKKEFEWLLSGDTGLSSEAMFACFRNITPGGKTLTACPRDPADLGRCIRFMERFPIWRDCLTSLNRLGWRWCAVVAHWDDLEALYLSEIDRPDCSAPATYRRMKALGL